MDDNQCAAILVYLHSTVTICVM